MCKKPVLLLIVAFVFLIGSISLFSEAEAGGGVFFLAAACVPAFFVVRSMKKNASSLQTKHGTSTKTTRNSKTATLSDIPGYSLQYHYNDVKIAGYGHYDTSSARVGALLTLAPEPDNAHDAKAVAVLLDGKKLGYLPANRLQDMYYDYLERGGTVVAKVFACVKDSVDMLLGYYTNDLSDYKYLLKSGAPSKTFKLTANANSDMQENISLCSVGDPVTYAYDYEKEKYAASASYAAIGFFPVAANALLEENDDLRAYISEIGENDNGKQTAYVDVFLAH